MKIKKRLLKDLYKSTTPELQTVMEAIYPDVFVKEKKEFTISADNWYTDTSGETFYITSFDDSGAAYGYGVYSGDYVEYTKNPSWQCIRNSVWMESKIRGYATKQEIKEVKKLKKEYERDR